MPNSSTASTRRPAAPFSDKKRRLFLDKLRDSGNVRAACQAANIGRTTAYDTYKEEPAFAALWETAMQEAIDLLEAKAWQNAMRKDSETSLWNLLKAHRPEKYREQLRVSINITGIAERIAAEMGLPVFDVLEEAEATLVRNQEQR